MCQFKNKSIYVNHAQSLQFLRHYKWGNTWEECAI